MLFLYDPLNDEFIESDKEDDIHYCWEEQDWEENRCLYEYDLEHLEELAKREKM